MSRKKTDGAKNTASPIKDFFACIADWLNSRGWILKVIVQFMPGLWSPLILNTWKTQLTDSEGLNKWGRLLVFVIYGGALIVTGLTTYKTVRDEKRKKKYEADLTALDAEIQLRKTVTAAENIIECKKVRRIKDRASNVVSKKLPSECFVAQALDPKECINSILDEIRVCFSKVTPITKENIHVSAAYSLDGKTWLWLASLSNEDVASITDLLTQSSAFRVVSENTQSYFYANDKEEAARKGQYYADARDRSRGNKGSIICWKIMSAFSGEKSIQMIISISTYGQRFVETEDVTEMLIEKFYNEKIREVILQQFENELVEALLLYKLTI